MSTLSNQVYENDTVKYIDYELDNINNNLTTQPTSVTLSLTGPFPGILFNFSYTIFSKKQVTLYWDNTFNTTSNGTSNSITSTTPIPLNIIPSTSVSFSVPLILAANQEVGYITISNTGFISIKRLTVPGLFPNGTVCGIVRNQITYIIN